MIVAQVFLEAMEGCHLFLSPFFVMQTRVFRVSPSAIVQIFVWPGCKDGLPLISSSGVGSPSRLSSSVSFHSFRRAFAPALQRCSFSSSSQPELLFLAGFLRSFGRCPFSHGSQALFFVLATVVGDFESCPLAVSCEALFPLLTGFVGPFDKLSVCSDLRGALSSADWFRWTFRKLLVCVELRGALPSARWFRWPLWQLPVCVPLRGVALPPRLWQTDRETPRELTASCHLRGEDANISTLRAELFAPTPVPNISPLTRGNKFTNIRLLLCTKELVHNVSI